MTMRCMVVDDESLAVTLMCKWLQDFPDIDVVGTCKNGREAIDQCESLRPDVMFLDIQMPGLTGLDVVARLQSDVMPLVVFTTAYDEYALQAFDVNAIDYLLKPIEKERLDITIHRLRQRLATPLENGMKPSLVNAIASLDQHRHTSSMQARKLAIKDAGEIILLPFETIEWVDAAGDYMCVHSNGETHIMRATMKELESRLAGGDFIRIHRSTIVNAAQIVSVGILPKGEAELTLKEGARLKVSRSFRQNIQHLLK